MKKKANPHTVKDFAKVSDESYNRMCDSVMEKINKDDVRKGVPLFKGVLCYFPDALEEVAKASLAGNKQHLDGQPLHWDKTKSMQQEDSLLRHLNDVAKGIEVDDDGVLHRAKIAWRALASLQIYLENNK
jgi:hypothetical protein